MTNDRILRRGALLCGLLFTAFVAFATLSPIEWRPQVAGAGGEHVAAFAVLGLCFGLALPRRFAAIAVFLLLLAVSLEAAQTLVPTRHGRLADLVQKLVGGGLGLWLAYLAEVLLVRRLRRRDGSSEV